MTVITSISVYVSIAVVIGGLFAFGARQSYRAITRHPEWWQQTEGEYRETFDSATKKTPVEASSFFNLDRLYEIVVARKLLLARVFLNQGHDLAGTFVGLGILGTFVGLMLGLGGFDTSDTETIRISVQSLLDGIRTAFSTSIVGIAASIIYTHFVQNPSTARIETALAERCEKLDAEHYVNPDVATLDQLRLSHEEFTKQTAGISSFSDDIAAALGNAIDELNEKQFKPMNEQMELAVGEFINVAQEIKNVAGNTGTEIVQTVMLDFQKGLEQLLGEFLGWFSEEAKDEMRQLVEGLGTTKDALSNIPETIKESLESVSDIVTTQTELFSETVQRANQQTEQTMSVLEQLSAVSDRFEHTGGIITSALETVDNVWREMEGSVSRQREQIQTVLDTLTTTSGSIESSAGHMANAIESFSQTEEQIERVFASVEESIGTYSEAVERSLDGYLKAYTQETTNMLQRLAQAFESLKDDLETLNTMDQEKTEQMTQALERIRTNIEELNAVDQAKMKEVTHILSENVASVVEMKDVLDRHVTLSTQLHSLFDVHSKTLDEGHTKFASSATKVAERLDQIVEKINERGRGVWRR